MATTMAASALARPATSSSLVPVRAAKLSLQPASPGRLLVRCSPSNGVGAEQSRAESAEMGAPRRLSALMVPMLAAAVVVGGVQPVVQASEWDKFLVPVDFIENPAPDDKYRDLLDKMKERRAARERKPATVQAEQKKNDVETNSLSSFFAPALTGRGEATAKEPPTVQAEGKKIDEEPNPFSSLFSPAERGAATSKEPRTVQAEEKKTDEEPNPFSSFFSPAPTAPAPKKILEPAPAVAAPSPVQVVPPVVATESPKSHGFLPLFVAQLLVLVATVGGGYVLITTPDGKWEELQKTVEGYVSKVTPAVQDSWATAKPLATQAQQKASRFAEVVKPYVIKAWEVSKPLAAKAVEASKPILKGAQNKAVELFQQASSDK